MERGTPLGSFDNLKKTMSRRMTILSTADTKQHLHGKKMFRAIVRMVMANLSWLSDVSGEQLGGDYRRNVMLLKKRRRGPQTLLTLQEKTMLMKPWDRRTVEERDHLYYIIKNIRCFEQYPEEVQKQLAFYMYFQYYGPNRMILRQGHEPYAIYFILQGEVIISTTLFDKVLNAFVTEPVGIMGVGDKFGEVSLLHDSPRTATVISSTDVELLALRKRDFMKVLRDTIMQEWESVISALGKFGYFDLANDVLVREACILAKLLSFSPGTTIYGDGQGRVDYTYFIISGQCRIIEIIKVDVHNSCKKRIFRLVANDTDPKSLKPGHQLETHFIQVGFYNKLEVFGIGEKLYGRRIIAVTPLEVLLLPTHWLHTNNTGNIWERLRRFLDQNQPSPEKVFQQFVDTREWHRYRQQLVSDLRAKNGQVPSGTSPHDVPYSLRLQENVHYYRPGYICTQSISTGSTSTQTNTARPPL